MQLLGNFLRDKILKIMAFCAVFTLCYAHVSSSSHYTKDIQKIIERGKLIVAIHSMDVPPFIMTTEHGVMGLDIELAQKLADLLHVELELNRHATSFDMIVDIVASGQADIGLSKLSHTNERAKKVFFSIHYIELQHALLLNRLRMSQISKQHNNSSLELLMSYGQSKESTIGVLQGSAHLPFAYALFSQADILPMRSWERDVLPKILTGEFLAAMRDSVEVLKLLYILPDANLYVLPIVLGSHPDRIHIVVNPEMPHLLSWVNNVIRTLPPYDVDTVIKNYVNHLFDKESYQILQQTLQRIRL